MITLTWVILPSLSREIIKRLKPEASWPCCCSEKVVNIFYWVNYKQKIYKSQNILWSYYSIFVWVCHCHLSVDPILSEFQAHQLILGTEKRLRLIFGGFLTRFHTRIYKVWIRVSCYSCLYMECLFSTNSDDFFLCVPYVIHFM